MVSSFKEALASRGIDRATFEPAPIARSIRYGEKGEEIIKRTLKLLGHTVTDSTRTENIEHDIDAYVDGVPTSFKTHLKKYHHLGFLFETRRYSKAHSTWFRSWYYTGKAEQYIVLKPHEDGTAELWLLKKKDVKDYEQTRGWDRTIGLLPSTKAEQALHNQSDSECGSINKFNARQLRVATLIVKIQKCDI